MALMGDDGRRTKGEQRVGESSMAGGALRACAVRGAAAVPGRRAAPLPESGGRQVDINQPSRAGSHSGIGSTSTQDQQAQLDSSDQIEVISLQNSNFPNEYVDYWH